MRQGEEGEKEDGKDRIPKCLHQQQLAKRSNKGCVGWPQEFKCRLRKYQGSGLRPHVLYVLQPPLTRFGTHTGSGAHWY